MYLESDLGVDEIIDLAPDHVLVATGARWTNFLYSSMEIPVGQLEHPNVFTPDDIAAGRLPEGPTLVFDFDNYYMGGVITEHLAAQGIPVTYATPAGQASAWTIMTNELPLVARALTKRNVPVRTQELVSAFDGETVTLSQIFTGEKTVLDCRNVVITGLRLPRAEFFEAMTARAADLKAAGIKSFSLVGDALAPGALAHAVHSGHRAAQELGLGPQPFRRDAPIVEFEPSYTSTAGLVKAP
jgi:dimethylamine/trimethylamine dehydrogenase